MNVTISLIGQTITFLLFIGITMKFIWPHVTKALDERREKIADGLAAAERGQHDLELAQHKSAEMLRDAKVQVAQIVEEATRRAERIVEESKERAREEGQNLLNVAKIEIEQEVAQAREQLRGEVAAIAISGAEKILRRNIDKAANNDMIDELVAEL